MVPFPFLPSHLKRNGKEKERAELTTELVSVPFPSFLTQSNLYSYTSMLQASRSILADSGVKGLFQGFTATAIRDAPYAGLYVLAYEESKSVCGELHSFPCSFLPFLFDASCADVLDIFSATLLSVRPQWDVPSSVIHSLSGQSRNSFLLQPSKEQELILHPLPLLRFTRYRSSNPSNPRHRSSRLYQSELTFLSFVLSFT